jgi:hypothetical protein
MGASRTVPSRRGAGRAKLLQVSQARCAVAKMEARRSPEQIEMRRNDIMSIAPRPTARGGGQRLIALTPSHKAAGRAITKGTSPPQRPRPAGPTTLAVNSE